MAEVDTRVAGSSKPPGDGKHFAISFSYVSTSDGKGDLYGIAPDGSISRLKRDRRTWVDTGVSLPAITDTNR